MPDDLDDLDVDFDVDGELGLGGLDDDNESPKESSPRRKGGGGIEGNTKKTKVKEAVNREKEEPIVGEGVTSGDEGSRDPEGSASEDCENYAEYKSPYHGNVDQLRLAILGKPTCHLLWLELLHLLREKKDWPRCREYLKKAIDQFKATPRNNYLFRHLQLLWEEEYELEDRMNDNLPVTKRALRMFGIFTEKDEDFYAQEKIEKWTSRQVRITAAKEYAEREREKQRRIRLANKDNIENEKVAKTARHKARKPKLSQGNSLIQSPRNKKYTSPKASSSKSPKKVIGQSHIDPSARIPTEHTAAGKQECHTCGFKWYRSAAEAGKKICPKCQSKLIPRKPEKLKASDALESESGVCAKNNGGPHKWKLGKCSICGKSQGIFKTKSSKGGVRVNCKICEFSWIRPPNEKHRKDCPKCFQPLEDEHRDRKKLKANDAIEAESGVCSKNNGGPHKWKYGKCSICGKSQGTFKTKSSKGGVRVNCKICEFSWIRPPNEKHRKDCPKCFQPLEDEHRDRKKLNANDAIESESGVCPKGGKHKWKFGKCSKCNVGQGNLASNQQVSDDNYEMPDTQVPDVQARALVLVALGSDAYEQDINTALEPMQGELKCNLISCAHLCSQVDPDSQDGQTIEECQRYSEVIPAALAFYLINRAIEQIWAQDPGSRETADLESRKLFVLVGVDDQDQDFWDLFQTNLSKDCEKPQLLKLVQDSKDERISALKNKILELRKGVKKDKLDESYEDDYEEDENQADEAKKVSFDVDPQADVITSSYNEHVDQDQGDQHSDQHNGGEQDNRDQDEEGGRVSPGGGGDDYQSQAGGYQSQGDGYQSQGEGYQSQGDGYRSQGDGYQSQGDGYQSQGGGYQSQGGGYQSQGDGYQSQGGGYQSQGDGYQSQGDGYQSQGQVEPGAY